MASSEAHNMNRSLPSNIETLVNAGKTVEEIIKRDQECPDLFNLLNGQSSGLYRTPLISSTEEFLKTSSVPTPELVLRKLEAGAQRGAFMGLLPEIGRAWASVDQKLYIWSYTKPTSIYEYDDQDQVVTTVGLVKPKPNIFGPKINYLLVLTTALQVIVLALSVNGDEFRVFATELNCPVDDYNIERIMGTEDGRIFMHQKEGNVFEFHYKHPDSWLTRTYSWLENKSVPSYSHYVPSIVRGRSKVAVKSMAIDDERKILYLCSATSIEVIYLGDRNNDYQSVANNTTIIQDVQQMYRSSYNPDVFTLQSVHVISKAESKYVHLMAITSGGFRLYFTTSREGFRNKSLPAVPNALELGHVRLPPPPIAQVPGQPYPLARIAYYDCGICMTARQINDDNDTIHVTAGTYDNNKTAQPSTTLYGTPMQTRTLFEETYAVVETNAVTYQLAESNTEKKGHHYLKEISQQLCDPPRQFITISSRQIEFYNKLRPVDALSRILTRQNRTEAEEQKECQQFFERYGRTESCAMCLSVICNIQDPIVVNKATRLFFELGGVPTAASATQAPGNHLGQVVGQTSVNYSGRHDGFVLYLARLVAPIWQLKVFADRDPTNPESRVLHAKVQRLLYDARGNLESLEKFMNTNSSFHDSANIADPRFQTADRTKIELDLAEQKSVRELYLLLIQCIGAVYFIEFLLDSDVQSILTFGNIHSDDLQQIRQLDINTMLTTFPGREASRELVIGAIAKYGATTPHTNFDVISSRLERWCGTFFSEKDILFFKGMENLKLAHSTDAEYEKTAAVKQSLSYFSKAADNISEQKLKLICGAYIQFAYHIGVIELVLERAKKLDPQNLALSAYESPQQRDEPKIALLQARMKSYGYALNALNDTLLISKNQLPPNRIPIANPNAYVRHVIDAALNNDDPLFHYTFYQWLLENNMQEHLLTISSPYLVTFFNKYVGEEETSMGFLSQYYREKEMYEEAAVCSTRLASADSPTLSLQDRLKYLSQASMNIRCAMGDHSSRSDHTQFHAVLQERVETCQVQQRIQDILRSQSNNVEAQVAADNLDRQLLNKATLKAEFVSRFPLLLQHVL